MPERETALPFWRHIGFFILLLCLLLRFLCTGGFYRSAFLCLWGRPICPVLFSSTGSLERSSPGCSRALGLCGGQHCLPHVRPHWHFNSENTFVCGLEGDHLAQITIQQSLLTGPCKTGCVREDCKGARGTRAFICAHNDVWAVGLAFTVMLVFFSFLWSDFCEEQVCLHACDQLVRELDREVDMYVVDREVRLA